MTATKAARTTGIEWTDATWNPVIGCTPISPGCLNCYAATMANRMQHMPHARDYHPSDWAMSRPGEGETERRARVGDVGEKIIRIAEIKNGRAVFTGDVRTLEHRLTDPLKWKKPRTVFVCSMSDLFHASVPTDFIDKVFAIMALCPQHTFQVLTKRTDCMEEYTSDYKVAARIWDTVMQMNDAITRAVATPIDTRHLDHQHVTWPLPNVWLGTSVEDQQRADTRIPRLLRCPAAVRFLSCEPLLEDVTLHLNETATLKVPSSLGVFEKQTLRVGNYLHWVIVGGESGHNARPFDVLWAQSIIGQCKEAGVACFVKQLGSKPMLGDGSDPHGWPAENSPVDFETGDIHLKDKKGGDPAEWPERLRVRQMPTPATF